MDFEVVGEITHVEAIAAGNRIRGIRELQKRYGKGRWRKLKGIALVRIYETGAKPNSTGTRRTASAADGSKSRDSLTRSHSRHRFVVCVDSGGHDDLQVRRIYQSVPDSSAARSHYIRVFDDSGEDYLYPAQLFLSLPVSPQVRDALENGLVVKTTT